MEETPSFEITHFGKVNQLSILVLQIKTLLILIVSDANWFEVRLSTNLKPFEFYSFLSTLIKNAHIMCTMAGNLIYRRQQRLSYTNSTCTASVFNAHSIGSTEIAAAWLHLSYDKHYLTT